MRSFFNTITHRILKQRFHCKCDQMWHVGFLAVDTDLVICVGVFFSVLSKIRNKFFISRAPYSRSFPKDIISRKYEGCLIKYPHISLKVVIVCLVHKHKQSNTFILRLGRNVFNSKTILLNIELCLLFDRTCLSKQLCFMQNNIEGFNRKIKK